MAKLPKNLRKSLQQGRGGSGGQGGGPKGGSRQMRRMMDRMGIDMQEVPAQQVIFKCDEYDMVIQSPQVSLINQAGQEIYQVLGKAEKVAKGEIPEIEVGEPLGDFSEEGEEIPEPVSSISAPQITPDDIKLVAAQAQVTEEIAAATLKRTNGNIAQAIIELKSKQ